MAKQIKKFFRNEKSVSKLIFSVLIIGLAFLIIGQGVYAYFYRTLVKNGWGYGYGYGRHDSIWGYGWGYGYGYGDPTTWRGYGFWGIDGKATSVSVTAVAKTSLTVSYYTDYIAQNRIEYGTSASAMDSATSWSSWQEGTNTITVSGLSCGTTYYYKVATRDANGTVWYSTDTYHSASTASCVSGSSGGGSSAPSSEEPTSITETSNITASEGGEVTLTNTDGTTATVNIPAEGVSSDVTVTITTVGASEVSSPQTGWFMVGNIVYDISAEDAEGNAVTDLSKAATLTFTYTDDQIAGLDESTLKVYYWDGDQWVGLESTVDADNNTITATTTHFTYFAIMGQKPAVSAEGLTVAQLKAKIKEIIKQLIALIQSLIEKLQEQLAELQAGNILNTDLKQGDRGDQVKLLQTWLAKDSEVYPEAIISGWFGPLTKAAVIRFQEKYKDDILTPLGLTEGTGYVGEATRAKLNQLYKGQ